MLPQHGGAPGREQMGSVTAAAQLGMVRARWVGQEDRP